MQEIAMNKQLINIGNTGNQKIITKEPYQLSHILMVLVGVLMLFAGGIMLVVGLIIAAIGAVLLYNTYSKNQDTGEYLVLELNCGRNIFLYCKTHDFAVELVDTIINCINSGKEYKISMDNCKIESCQFGDGNLLIRR